MSVWNRMCTVGWIACASTWEEATVVLRHPVHLTTNGILCQGMSCLLFPGMLLKILLPVSPWPTSPVCGHVSHSQEVNNPSGARGLLCVPSSESGQKNQFILQQRLPALSCQVSWNKSAQCVMHQGTSRIPPQQGAFYRVIEPTYLWNCLFSLGVAWGFSGLSAFRALALRSTTAVTAMRHHDSMGVWRRPRMSQ